MNGAAKTGADYPRVYGAGEMALVEERIHFVALLEAGDAGSCCENRARRIGARDDG